MFFILKQAGKVLLFLLTLCVGLLLLAFGFLQTPPVKGYIQKTVNNLDLGALKVQVHDVGGLLPFSLHLGRLQAWDQQGQFVAMRDFQLALSLSDLLQGRIGIERLTAHSLVLKRLPDLPPSEPEPEPETPDQGGLKGLPPIQLTQLRIDRLSLGPSILGRPAVLRLSGQGKWLSMHRAGLTLDLEQTDAPGLALHIQSSLRGPEPELQIEARLRDVPGGLLLHRIDVPGKEPLRLQIEGTGPSTEWQGSLHAELGEHELLRSELGLHISSKRLRLRTQTQIQPSPLLNSLPPAVRSLAHSLHLKTNLTTSPALDQVQLSQLQLKTPAAELNLSGRADLSQRQIRAEASLDIPELDKLQPVAPTGLHGSTWLRIEAQGAWDSPQLDLNIVARDLDMNDLGLGRAETTVTGRLDLTQGLIQASVSSSLSDVTGLPYPEVVGPKVQIQSRLNLSQWHSLDLKSLQLTAQHMQAQVNGTLGLDHQTLDMAWQVQGPPLELLAQGLQGASSASGRIQGRFDALDSNIRAQVQDLSAPGLKPSQATCSFQGLLRPAHPEVNGTLELELSRGSTRIQAGSPVHLQAQTLNLARIRLQAPQTRMQGNLGLNLASSTLDSNLELDVERLDWLSTFTAHKVQGSLNLQAEAQGPLSSPRILAHGRVREVQAFGAGLQNLNLEAELQDLSSLAGRVQLSGQGIAVQNTRISKIQVQADGDQGRVDGRLQLQAELNRNLDFRTQGHILHQDEGWTFNLTQGQGNFGDLPFQWSQSLQAELTSQGFQLSWPQLEVGQGRISCTASQTGDDIQAKLQASDLDLGLIPDTGGYDLRGLADLQATISGSMAEPRMDMDLALRQLYMAPPGMSQVPTMQLKASGTLSQGELSTELTLQSDQAMQAQAELKAPVQLSLRPFALTRPQTIQGQVQAHLDLQALSRALMMDTQSLQGQLSCDLAVNGELPYPNLQGRIQVQKAAYEHIQTGTLLQDISATLELQGYRAVLTELQATDGGQGKLEATAEVQFHPQRPLSYSGQLQLDQATLVRLETTTASLSGTMDVSGNTAGAQIQADLKAFPVRVGIPEPGPPGLQGLRIVRGKEPETPPGHDEHGFSPPGFAQNTDLDVRVTIPGGLYVQGRGLYSKWEGELHITGTGAKPHITGSISVIQGHLNLLGKRFELDRGRITFYGQYPPAPEINVISIMQHQDLQVRVAISGPATNPSFELQSDPSLPRDEILARILFNQELSQITTVQAVKLAMAVRTLTTGGGGGIMSTLRQSIGVDELSIQSTSNQQNGEDNGSGMTVGVGKYLNEKVYFKVEKGLQEDTGRVIVNIQISPHLSVETQAGSTHQGVHFKWSYNYE